MGEKSPYLKCMEKGPESIKVPANVKKAAQKGLDMKKNGYNGGVETGLARAKQLAKCEYISVDALSYMKNFYSRHMYTSLPGYLEWQKDGKPIEMEKGYKNKRRGAVAILIWGGLEAFNWIKTQRCQNLLNRYFPNGKNDLKSLSYYKKNMN